MSGVATNMSDDFTYLGYTDEVHTKLDSIEQRLLQLGEELLLSRNARRRRMPSLCMMPCPHCPCWAVLLTSAS